MFIWIIIELWIIINYYVLYTEKDILASWETLEPGILFSSLPCINDQWKETQSQGSQGYYLERAGSKETRRNGAFRVVFIRNAWLSRHIVHLLLSIYVGRIDDRLNAGEKICTSRDTTPGEISLQAVKQAHKAPFQI